MSTRNGVALDFPATKSGLAQRIQSKSWHEFASTMKAVFSCFQSQRDFHDAVVQYAKSLADENVVYAEVHCSPWKHVKRGVGVAAISEGLMSGTDVAAQVHGVTIKIICDLVRDVDEDVVQTLDWFASLPRESLPAIGISGGPRSRPLSEFTQYCEIARDADLNVVAHAGELDGPWSVRFAIDSLGVDRLSHGVRVLEEPTLFEETIKRGIHYELCPSANNALAIGNPDYASIYRIVQSQASCSINTDDELIFQTSLSNELHTLASHRLITTEDLFRLQVQAISAAFMQPAERNVAFTTLFSHWQSLTQRFPNSSAVHQPTTG